MFELLNFITAFLVGIPFGVVFPARPRYLFIDMFGCILFFVSFSVVRFIEGFYIGDTVVLGLLYLTFLCGALAATRFNKVAQKKEEIIKRISEEQNGKE